MAAVWSGTISFGLVSLPVDVFPAHRGRAAELRMVDEDGHPLHRRYLCPEHDRLLRPDEVVRGHPVEGDGGGFVVVTDDELEQLAPDESHEIALETFVPEGDIDPLRYERSYFLTPRDGAARAYQLLARTMEASGRAGVATFVMRDRQHLVALLAVDGILRAVTLRFSGELRSPADVGLEPAAAAAPADVRRYRQAIETLARDDLDTGLLADAGAARLRGLVEDKLAHDRDVVRGVARDETPSGAEVADLVAALRERLDEAGRASRPASRKPARSKTRAGKARGSRRGTKRASTGAR